MPIVALLLSAVLGTTAMAPSPALSREWQPELGDVLYIDTRDNLGYLIHPSGRRFIFRVATGQRRTVRYIGLTYFAATPEGAWVAKSHHIQGDRITYGPEGHFLRMYKDGMGYTHYGIHTHASADSMLQENDRYASMGCIIVSKPVLDLLERTFAFNGEQLPVVTAAGPPLERLLAMME